MIPERVRQGAGDPSDSSWSVSVKGGLEALSGMGTILEVFISLGLLGGKSQLCGLLQVFSYLGWIGSNCVTSRRHFLLCELSASISKFLSHKTEAAEAQAHTCGCSR